MTMPKASMDEDDLSVTPKDQIRDAWEITLVQAKAISHPMDKATHKQFRACVFMPDPAHTLAARFRRKSVAHRRETAFSLRSEKRGGSGLRLTFFLRDLSRRGPGPVHYAAHSYNRNKLRGRWSKNRRTPHAMRVEGGGVSFALQFAFARLRRTRLARKGRDVMGTCRQCDGGNG